MTKSVRRLATSLMAMLVFQVVSTAVVYALQPPITVRRFDPIVVDDPTASLDVATTPVESLAATDRARAGWERFHTANGPSWSIYLDRRSGAPLLVEGQGIEWAVGKAATVDSLAPTLRAFIAGNKDLFLADDAELVLSQEASGLLQDDVWQVVFDRAIGGIPVEGERYMFTIGHGRLISFGTPRWSRIDASPFPVVDAAEAQERLSSYMSLTPADGVEIVEKPALRFIPLRSGDPSAAPGPYRGAIGSGYASALVWRMALRVSGEPGNWVGWVDAHTGAIRAFYDDNKYARLKGGVYPVSDDQVCPDGCEQPNFPMPFATVTIAGSPQFASTNGVFNCTPAGSNATTALSGQYFKVLDTCGIVSQSVACDADLDLRTSGGIDCTVPSGASAGDTHAARSSFYHLNRIAEHARSWLPANGWVRSQVTDNVNLNQTCNAYWGGGSVNFFKSGGGCNNTGEIAGVFLHEWGHGLDQNDGGNFDNPSEAYADITSLIATHVSCMGRGFHPGSNCGGYGNACLACTGIRDLDWNQRYDHQPSTPSGFAANNCPVGTGPCGREVHCEGYIGGETIYDLATRDLPASGLDLPTAWQLVDKLWYKSRLGSGGNAWSCSLPNSDGCSAVSWFSKMRAIDDDDGNLANGTPHAAAIYAAFARHGIACGTAASQSNQNSSSCPTILAPTLSATIGSGKASLAWTPVSNAASYRILRNDASCTAGSTIIATAATTSYTDTGLGNGFTEYYTIQALGSNSFCEGVLSNCVAATPQPFAGAVKLSAPSFSCAGTITVTVTDGNIGAGTTSVSLVSTTEPTPEAITLTQIAPGSDTYTGTITLAPSAPVHDGVLSVQHGDAISATYIDASDGGGGLNIPRLAAATVDCVVPVITKVQATAVTGTSAKITWSTNELADSTAHYGTAPPPASSTSVAASVMGHAVDLAGLSECTPYVYSVDSTDVVGNTATDTALGAYYAFTTNKTALIPFASTDTPIPIPDSSSAGITSTITVPDARTVQKIVVVINVQHTHDSDLTFSLITPTGLSILLANPHGGSGDNYTNTVLDDAAAIPISGPAPFTGTFRPDSPLYVANGINAAGDWKFKAVDNSGQDVGTILNWTLQLTFATPSCAPHAFLRSAARVADSCVSGGAGNGNAYWDAGEDVQFKLSLANDGATALTNVTATVTTSSPGVVVTQSLASFPAIPSGSVADSLAPHVAAHLATSLACLGAVDFQVAIQSDQGSWSGSSRQTLGRPTNGTGRVLSEGFDAGIPATWTVLDGGIGGGSASKWTAANPGVRAIAPPMFVPVATVDSDAAGPGAQQDESLLSPVLNLSAATSATLEFDQYFRWFSGGSNEIADVDVRSSLTGGAWVNVLRQQGASSANPDHKTVDVAAQAAGASDAQLRFRSWNGSNEQYWQIDNVTLDAVAAGSCDMPVCTPPTPGSARPVADGIFGAAMLASRIDPAGSSIALAWDVATCASGDHHVLYGDLASVASLAVTGAACDLGTAGSATWASVPGGSLWFVVVGDDNGPTEASWGTDGVGGQRGGSTPSGRCGAVTRDNTGTCP